jgi:hypothetical protein
MRGGRSRSRSDGEAVSRLGSRAVDFKLTDEQRDFVAAIRDFCERGCGNQEKREQPTNRWVASVTLGL